MALHSTNRISLPPVTLNLIIINVLFWLAQIALVRVNINLTDIFGMHYFQASSFRVWQLITYAFLHDTSNFGHVFFNMFALFMFGISIEQLFGGKRFLLYYIVCALAAALTQQIVWAIDLMPIVNSGAESISLADGLYPTATILNRFITVGASGAVFGILLAFGWFFPNAAIFLFFIPIPIKAKYFVVIYGLIELLAGISSSGDGVAHFAHVGGMIGGLILILLWRKSVRKQRSI